MSLNVTHVRFKVPVRIRTSEKGAGEEMSGLQRPADTAPKHLMTYDSATGLLRIDYVGVSPPVSTYVTRENIVQFYATAAEPETVVVTVEPPPAPETKPASPRGRGRAFEE